MVGGFFPAPYPDECLYSILCRHYVRSGATNLNRTRQALFGGQQCLASAVFFPIRLDLVDKWYGPNSGITREYLANNHTMHPYMRIVYSENFRRQTDRVMRGETAPKNFDKTGTQRSHRLWPQYLRYCPCCVREDVETYGEPYWHRVHQLPAMLYCTKHRIKLYNSAVEVVGTHMGLHPASDVKLHDVVPDFTDKFSLYKDTFIRIGLESEWLLRHGADVDWEFDLHAKYKSHLRDKRIATVQGVSDYSLIENTFETYWGRDFFDCLREELSDEKEWIRQIYEHGLTTFKPIYHILLMCFLCGSVDAFLKNKPQENIFGNSPWGCLNPLCEHNNDGVETVDIQYANGVATGFFKCSYCGMVYKQRYRRKQFSSMHIVEYGHIWIDRMIRCFEDEMLEIPTAAKILECKPHIVQWQLQKLKLAGKPIKLKNARLNLPGISTKEYYKAQVLNLAEQYNELTTDILRQYAPKAYTYLYKFELDWLHKHIVLIRDSQKCHADDEEMLKNVQAAFSNICENGMPTRQITRALIAGAAGYNENALVCIDSKNRTKAYIESVAENRIDWLRRRITAIAQDIRTAGGKISIADIKREMSLKPNTFIKYENFLKELIDELNEQL